MLVFNKGKVMDFTRFAHVVRIGGEYICFMSTKEAVKYIMSHKNKQIKLLK